MFLLQYFNENTNAKKSDSIRSLRPPFPLEKLCSQHEQTWSISVGSDVKT